MHRSQEQDGPSLGRRGRIEQGQHRRVFGDGPADGRVGDPPVVLDRRGEGAEVVRQRQVDDHAAQKLAGRSGLSAPKKNHSRTSAATVPAP